MRVRVPRRVRVCARAERGAVDYILFFTGDVDVTANPNEIRDWKYVSKEELQAMFDAPGTPSSP
jgi:isopentenyldiphosphate isomerase